MGTDVLVALTLDSGQGPSLRNADLEYLSLFTNVYYSEMLDQYHRVHMR